MQVELFTVQRLCERYGVQPITIRRWIAAGMFPQPIRIGRRKVFWPVSLIHQHEAAAAEAAGVTFKVQEQKEAVQ